MEKISFARGSHVFWRIMVVWKILVDGHQWNISERYTQIGLVISDKKAF